MSTPIRQFFKEHGISEVEAVVPDMAGIARGKVMPAMKFAEEEGMRMPESIFLQTVTGDYPEDDRAINPSEIDIVLKADPGTTRVVPWAAEPTAQVIHDSYYADGRPVTMAAFQAPATLAEQALWVMPPSFGWSKPAPRFATRRPRPLRTTIPAGRTTWHRCPTCRSSPSPTSSSTRCRSASSSAPRPPGGSGGSISTGTDPSMMAKIDEPVSLRLTMISPRFL